jgi:DNA-binding transcriptional ArsR family regulator
MTLFELLSDPVRARIYIEVLLHGEITAQELMRITKISRSTISHHLTRFVSEEVLTVRIHSTGRAVKLYSINRDYTETLFLASKDDVNKKKRQVFLETASAHLQVISNLILERSQAIENVTPKEKRTGKPVTFSFHFVAEEHAKIWGEEYEAFERRFRERCSNSEPQGSSFDFIAFGGLVPTRKSS